MATTTDAATAAAAAAPPPPPSSEDFAVGCILAVKTTLGDEFEAQIITFDKPSNVLVLQEGSKSAPRPNLRFLKANYIKEFTLLGQGEDPLDLKKCCLDINAIQAREEAAISAGKQR
ncbi:hypothetical protein Syun_020667 [Stephania yunnanensis]|uniref:LSM12 LSM domain-containing protein n=1 Tax=Stephania yunnanensis TaxID=152371 RepID=A0AAP0IEM5_9MAGN